MEGEEPGFLLLDTQWQHADFHTELVDNNWVDFGYMAYLWEVVEVGGHFSWVTLILGVGVAEEVRVACLLLQQQLNNCPLLKQGVEVKGD